MWWSLLLIKMKGLYVNFSFWNAFASTFVYLYKQIHRKKKLKQNYWRNLSIACHLVHIRNGKLSFNLSSIQPKFLLAIILSENLMTLFLPTLRNDNSSQWLMVIIQSIGNNFGIYNDIIVSSILAFSSWSRDQWSL